MKHRPSGPGLPGQNDYDHSPIVWLSWLGPGWRTRSSLVDAESPCNGGTACHRAAQGGGTIEAKLRQQRDALVEQAAVEYLKAEFGKNKTWNVHGKVLMQLSGTWVRQSGRGVCK